MFFAPVLTAVPSFATAPVLVVVGALMATSLSRIEWEDPSEGIAAFVTALGIPATFSISDGLAMGVAVYLGSKALGGRFQEIPWVMWALGGIFVLRFLFIPLE
jgi:AGZA family xanthine/uracil permease-like MFS transporter